MDDFIFTLSPGLAIGIWDAEKRRTDGFLDRLDPATVIDKGRGSFFAIDYTAIPARFAKTTSQNAFDQDARSTPAGRRALDARRRRALRIEIRDEHGLRQPRPRNTLSAEVNATYRVSEKTALDASVSFRANDPEDYVRSTSGRRKPSPRMKPRRGATWPRWCIRWSRCGRRVG